MGLPASQRRVLEKIENALRGSDPRLASLFAIFGRLTRDEDMPGIEELRHRMVLTMLRLRLMIGPRGRPLRARRRSRQAGRPRVALVFPLALALIALTIVAAARFGGTSTCTAIAATSNAAKQLPRSRLCRPGMLTPGFVGR